jgi:hypothetical protein
MNFATNRKEHLMKSSATDKLVRLAVLVGPAALAATAALDGMVRYSDATLKQEITTLDGSLAKLRRL